ncbi:MAG: signal peptidase I [Epulopiscium sp. Nuni2H_MBin001]|nr:MAG: signal peptidase I [Epulopiscium sp. Nuni2H_MBin001]
MNKNLLKQLMRFAKDVTIAFIATVLFTQFVLQNLQVRGHSMEPTLTDGQTILINKVYYKFNEPQVNDIVGFAVDTVEVKIVKRIIAVEGDVVDYIDGMLYVNEVAFARMDSGDIQYPFTVPEGRYFVVGDNVDSSIDSRYQLIGVICLEDILGKIVL